MAPVYMYDVVVKAFTFAISSAEKFLYKVQKATERMSARQL